MITFINNSIRAIKLSFNRAKMVTRDWGFAIGINRNGHTLRPTLGTDKFVYNFYYLTIIFYKSKFTCCLHIYNFK